MQALVALSAACGCFDYRSLPPSGVAPCTLLLLRAASSRPGLLVPPARTFKKQSGKYRRTSYDTPCSLFFGHPGVGSHTFKTTCGTNRRRVKIVRQVPTVVLRHEIPPHPKHPPLRDRRGQNTCLYIPLAYVCRSALSREKWRLARSKLQKFMLQMARRIGPAWAVSYFTDQLITAYSKYSQVGAQ